MKVGSGSGFSRRAKPDPDPGKPHPDPYRSVTLYIFSEYLYSKLIIIQCFKFEIMDIAMEGKKKIRQSGSIERSLTSMVHIQDGSSGHVAHV